MMMMMVVRAHIVVFLLFFVGVSERRVAAADVGLQCVTCASASLKQAWWMTGFGGDSSVIPDSGFVVDCLGATGTLQTEACTDACLTYIFDDPNQVATGAASSLLVVRGCASSLTGVVSTRTQSTGSSNGVYCEYDGSLPRPDASGRTQTTRALVEFCSQTRCNTVRTGTTFTNDNGSPCTGQTYNSTINNAPLACYQCDATNGNCKHDKCTKKYCLKSVVRVQNTRFVHKACSNVNPLGVDQACAQWEGTTAAPGFVSYRTKLTQCFCKDKMYCNGGENTLVGMLSSVLLVLFTLTAL